MSNKLKTKEEILNTMIHLESRFPLIEVSSLINVTDIKFIKQDFFQSSGKCYILGLLNGNKLILINLSNAKECIKKINKSKSNTLRLVIPKLDVDLSSMNSDFHITNLMNNNLTVVEVVS